VLPFVIVLNTVTVTFVPQQSSTAVGVSKLHAVPHSTVLFTGQVTLGGLKSLIVTDWLQYTSLLQQSVNIQVIVARRHADLFV